MASKRLTPPFPYMGGKSKVASEVWRRFGAVKNYIEPFFGSGAVLLARPGRAPYGYEVVNDLDGNLANFWRAVKLDPEGVARWADWPTNHIDLMARKRVVNQNEPALRERLIADPKWHDSELAGYYAMIMSTAIGNGLRSPKQIPCLAWDKGLLCHDDVGGYLERLSARLARVKVTSGDWTLVMGGGWHLIHGCCGVFLDPPYITEKREKKVYVHDCHRVGIEVREWCVRNGDNPLYRIALCGYDGEHNELEGLGWSVFAWKSQGGYAMTTQKDSQGKRNRSLERIWFSPACISEPMLFSYSSDKK